MNNWRDEFFQFLRRRGLFTRHYDAVSYSRMSEAAKDIHAELCHLDPTNLKAWSNVTLIDLANAYAALL
mgnify:CR=1 FL=1